MKNQGGHRPCRICTIKRASLCSRSKIIILRRIKQRPIKGYLKIETGGERGAVRIGADNLRYFERGGYVYKLLFFGKKNEKTIYKIVGSLLLSSRGRGETYLRLNPVDVDGKGNGLEHFQIAVVAAVSTTDSREPLHPSCGEIWKKRKK